MHTRYDRDRGRRDAAYPFQRQTVYYQDGNGLLVPAGPAMGGGLHRSHSTAGAHRPAQIVINNGQYEDRSVSRSPRSHSHHRRRSHGHDHHHDSSEDEHEQAYSPHRRRRPSKSHGSRSPSPYIDYELEKKLKKLEELEEKEKEDMAREKYEEERLVKEVKKAKAQAKKKEEDEELREKAIAEYNKKQKEEKEKKEKAEKEADEEFRARVKRTFGQAGYSEESIDKILKKEGKGKEHGHGHGKEIQIKIKDLTRPTYIKVHRKHLSPETLDEYNLPWEWDEVSYFPLCMKRFLIVNDTLPA